LFEKELLKSDGHQAPAGAWRLVVFKKDYERIACRMSDVNIQPLTKAVLSTVLKTAKGRDYYQDAMGNFFEEAREVWDFETLTDLEKRIGPIVNNVFMAFLHYFFSTTFSDEKTDEDWNAIDVFLATRHKLRPEQVHELTSLRWSFLSLYKILDIDLGKSMTVQDIVLQGKPFVLSEHRGTYAVKKGEVVATRVITTANGQSISAGEIFQAPKQGFEPLAMMLKTLSDECFKMCKKQMKSKEIPFLTDDVLMQSVRAVWAKEITSIIIHDALESAEKPVARTFVNVHGHPVRICTLTYKIPRAMHYAYGNKLAEQESIYIDNIIKTKAFLDWNEPNPGFGDSPNKKRRGSLAQKKESIEKDNALIVDSFCSREGGSAMELVNMATIEVSPGKMIVRANSRERALMMEEKIASILDIPMGSATWKIEDPKTFEETNICTPKSPKPSQSPKKSGLPPAQEKALLQEYFREYYQRWPDMNIPALGGKTPRELLKTPDGKIQVAQLLASFYERYSLGRSSDFDFLWAELGLEKPAYLKKESSAPPKRGRVARRKS
jgi:hypothetical protein